MFSKIKNNPIYYLFSRMWRHGAGHRVKIILAITLSMVAGAAWQSVPLVMAHFMNRAQEAVAQQDASGCLWIAAATFALGILAWAFHGPSRFLDTKVAFYVRRHMQLGLLAKVVRLPMKWHHEHHSGDSIDKIARAVSSLAEFSESAFAVIALFRRVLVAIVVIAVFLPSAGAIVATSTIIAVALIFAFDRVLVPMYRKGNGCLNDVAAKVQDYLTNITTVISLRLEDRVEQAIARRLDRFQPITEKSSIVGETKWFMSSAIVDFTRAATLGWFVLDATLHGRMFEVGTLFALNEYLVSLGNSFYDFTWRYGDLVSKATKVRAIEEIERDFDELVGARAEAKLPEGWKTVRLEGLSFRHATNSSETAGVSDIDLELSRGKSYAIVGSSGSGKSTLLALMRGLLEADAGSVACDGERIANGLAALSHHTTLIPQDPEIFAESVLSNVTMGIDASPESAMAALNMAHFGPVLDRLPRGLETNVAEKGISLSGGEKQRLALARGLFFAFDGDSEIILLDESTSSVDIVNERRIFKSILAHFREHVVVSTVHKFNLLPLFDEIIVMEHGRIVERGELRELLVAGGTLAAMWQQYTDATVLEHGAFRASTSPNVA